MRAHLSGLIYPGFVAATGYRRLPHLTRYLRGIERRLDKLPENPARDAANMAVAQRAEQAYQQAVADLPAARRDRPDVIEVRWMLEDQGQPVRPDPRHAGPGVGEPHPRRAQPPAP